jgi:hypothetical protein
MGNSDAEQPNYFIRVRGRILGPYSISQLATLRSRGQFGRANEFSTDGSSWQSAATIESLFKGGAGKKSRASTESDEAETQVFAGPPSR